MFAQLAAAPAHVSAHTEIVRGLLELSPELYRKALRLSGSESVAEDLVQDTVERAIRFRDSYNAGTNLRGWLHQIMFSLFVTRCRRARRERNAISALTMDPCSWPKTSQPNDEAPPTKLSPAMAGALETLPARFRDAIILVDLDELSYKEAARKLGVPVGTVMSRLHRGRKALAEVMQASGLAPEPAGPAASKGASPPMLPMVATPSALPRALAA